MSGYRRRRPGDPADRDPQRIGPLLDSVVGHFGVASSEVLSTLMGSWADIVGPDVARRTRPVEVRNRILVIAVDDAGWATELRFLSSSIVARVEELVGAGAVVRVRFVAV